MKKLIVILILTMTVLLISDCDGIEVETESNKLSCDQSLILLLACIESPGAASTYEKKVNGCIYSLGVGGNFSCED